ncbi:MAG: hypothetical protein DME25_17445 [Verrucomicrobia bacterium]|nr:MAG: hypothetical protein DME25_17445 [Verrucomicrobiota bacterium]
MDNGNLLRGAREPKLEVFKGGGQGGRIQEFSWDGKLLWDWKYATTNHLLHHDIEPLPNGNILAIAWEAKSAKEANRAGRRPDLTPQAGLWPDKIIEVEPQRPNGGRVVWEWHMWDHLIQNHDPEKAKYGDPSQHPERIDINGDGEAPKVDPAELARLKALGYVPRSPTTPNSIRSRSAPLGSTKSGLSTTAPRPNKPPVAPVAAGRGAETSFTAGATRKRIREEPRNTRRSAASTTFAGSRRACRAPDISWCLTTTPKAQTGPIRRCSSWSHLRRPTAPTRFRRKDLSVRSSRTGNMKHLTRSPSTAISSRGRGGCPAATP